MKYNFRRALALLTAFGCVSAAAGMLPVNAEDETTGKVIYATDFEDGDVSLFGNRGGDDTTVISASTDEAYSGTTSLLASGRSSSWNGPAIHLMDVCEPYTEYYISMKVRGKYYTNATLSMETVINGKQNWSNLASVNGGDWLSIDNVKVSFTDDLDDISIYIEGGTDDIYIDDFSIVEVPVKPIQEDIPSLSEVYKGYFKVGTALTPSDLSSRSFMALAEKHFGDSVTVGNEMKPDSVLDQAACLAYVEETGDDTVPQVSFAKAAPVLNYCRKNNIPVRVHTLVWHSQTPDWFFKENYDPEGDWVSSEKMLQRMENYIKNYFETLTELYPDVDFYACDVVNEAWSDNGGGPREPGEQGQNGSSKSAWVQVFGDNSFIEYAFTYARKYAPKGCKLYYNDYNEYMDPKMTSIYDMAASLKEKGLIDGIGMQSHLDARQNLDSAFPSVNMFNKALDKFASLGLDIQITELDATIPENSGDEYFDHQAEYYSGIMDAIVAHKDNISALIFWGITDDISWRAKQQPLLFDADYQAKPAFYSIIDGIEPVEPQPTEPKETDAPVTGDTMLGDVDENGAVNLLDVVLLNKNLMLGKKLTDQGRINADVDCNDTLNPTDSLNILKYCVKLFTDFKELQG